MTHGFLLIMTARQTRKRLKAFARELKKLRKAFKKMELRPCQNDRELIQKEKDLKILMDKIMALEKDRDHYMFHGGGRRDGFDQDF
jgi:hypothetical protein